MAERLAQSYLCERGLKLVAKNYRCPYGEIDLVMRDAEQLVFVEVRYRRRTAPVPPAVTVTAAKQRRIARSALHYLQHIDPLDDTPVRFDVIAVSGTTARPGIDWIAGAFDADEQPGQ